MSIEKLGQYFGAVEDPRQRGAWIGIGVLEGS